MLDWLFRKNKKKHPKTDSKNKTVELTNENKQQKKSIENKTPNELDNELKLELTITDIQDINHDYVEITENNMSFENTKDNTEDSSIFSELNSNQKEAVTATEGYVRVIAGAGSGKTKTLASRYAYLVKHMGISTTRILCVTFTNKASQEMKNRVKKILGNEHGNFLIYTYHGFCTYILREDIHHLFYPKNFIILDNEDQKAIIREIYGELGLKLSDKTFYDILDYIRITKNSMGNSCVQLLVNREPILSEETSDLYQKIFYMYLQKQRKNFGLDFNDLMLFVFYLFHNFTESKVKWQKRLEYIQVDEFQDNSISQYSFASILSEYHKNLFVVGDPDQTIYTWRGAKPELIINFDQNFPNVKTIILDLNYRSLQRILDVSNSLICKNKIRVDKSLTAFRELETQVIHYHGKNENDEAQWIVDKIKTLINSGVKQSEIAILYRANYQSRAIEQKCIQNAINYIIYGGIKFYERKEIKDVLSYLRLLTNEDDLSFLRVINEPTRKIGKVKINFIKEKANVLKLSYYETLKDSLNEKIFIGTGAKNFINTIEKYKQQKQKLTLTELAKNFIEEIGYEKIIREDGDQERLDNLQELYNSMLLFEKDYGEEFILEDYLSQISLYTDIDKPDNIDRIKLMTVHISKGLEFKHVFVYGMNEGIMPSSKSLTAEKLEEERRIAYVAMTRAKDGLYLTESEGINHNGQKYPSRFLFEIDRSKLCVEGDFDEHNNYWEKAHEHREQNNYKILSLNQKVIHPNFGEGTIIKIDMDSKLYEINFFTDNKTRTIMFNQSILKTE